MSSPRFRKWGILGPAVPTPAIRSGALRCAALCRPAISAALIAALIAPGLTPLTARPAQAEIAYANCQVESEAAFHAEIEKITLAALQGGLAKVDFENIVKDQWRVHGLDALIDKTVDKASEEIRDESSWGTLWGTLTSQERAKAIAEAVAERVYRSDAFKTAVEALAVDVGKDVAGSLELATLDAAIPAMECVRAFIGPKYGDTVARIVGNDTGRQFELTGEETSAKVSGGDVILEGRGAIAGAVILVVRRTLSNMARRVGQRVVGAVLSRLVAVVAGGIGLVLIAKDIWDLRHGVLPIIVAEMKSEDAKSKIRGELASAIGTQLGSQMQEVARETANRIVEVWREFKQAHAKVVELSGRLPDFKAFLDTVAGSQMPRVDRVVSLALAEDGEAGLIRRLENGTLDEAVKRLPAPALQIATDTRSLTAAFAWRDLAGDRLEKVAAFELHRQVKPASLTRQELADLLAVDDRLTVSRIVGLDAVDRASLLKLPPERLTRLTQALAPQDMAAVAHYLQGLSGDAAIRIMQAVSEDPTRMTTLGKPYVRQAIVASLDQSEAVGIMLRSAGMFDLANLQRDLELTLNGRVQPILMWERHPVAVIGFGVVALLILMIFNRLLFGGRRRAR